MYLIKNIIFDCRNNSVIVENGIKIKINDKHAIVKDEFWGETEINFGIYADLAELSECDETYDLLSYTSEYQIQNTRDEYKKIIVDVIDNPNISVVANINIGHATPRCIIPFGIEAEVDAVNQKIRFA